MACTSRWSRSTNLACSDLNPQQAADGRLPDGRATADDQDRSGHLQKISSSARFSLGSSSATPIGHASARSGQPTRVGVQPDLCKVPTYSSTGSGS
jgi:hypothetical protein